MEYPNSTCPGYDLYAPNHSTKGVESEKRIAILIFDNFSLSEISSISEIFFLANQLRDDASIDDPFYSLRLFSSTGGGVASSCSMRLWTDSIDTPRLNDCDALFIAGGEGAQQAKADRHILKCLRGIAPKTRFVKAIGEGSEILVAADLSQQHGIYNFPEDVSFISPHTNALHISDQILTLDDPKGSIAAALSIVKHDRGSVIAREISERSLPGSWNKLSAVLDDQDDGRMRQKIDTAAHWICLNYSHPITISDAAQVATMSESNFLRRFKAQIGLTPSEYLLRVRLDASCLLLSDTDLPVDKIARHCGARSGDGLAKMFRKRLSISPTEYRLAGRRKTNDGAS